MTRLASFAIVWIKRQRCDTNEVTSSDSLPHGIAQGVLISLTSSEELHTQALRRKREPTKRYEVRGTRYEVDLGRDFSFFPSLPKKTPAKI